MSAIDLAHALATAVDASKRAADHAVQRQKEGMLEISTKSNPRDFVTQVDAECQEIIINRIREDYPDHRFLGEEGAPGEEGNADSPFLWVIDPVDGTNPYIHGRDNYGNLIALQENDETVLGVINLPLRNDLFTGTKGSGALWNGNPVTLRNTKDMNHAILCCNLIHRAKEIDGVLRITTPQCSSIENYGSAAEEFALMLKGQNDGCFFEGIPLWDIAAGCFLVEEAGGKSEYRTSANGNCDVASSTAAIFDDLQEFVFTKMV